MSYMQFYIEKKIYQKYIAFHSYKIFGDFLQFWPYIIIGRVFLDKTTSD